MTARVNSMAHPVAFAALFLLIGWVSGVRPLFDVHISPWSPHWGLALAYLLEFGAGALPVVVLTARDAIADRVAGLDAGADDYVVKPFDLAELAARIRAVTRRKSGRAQPMLEHAGVTLDPATREVRRDGEPVALSPREFALLHALLEHPGRILSRAQLEERVYGWGEEVESNAVEVHVHALRRKLGAEFIRNVRGVGYRVAAPAA